MPTNRTDGLTVQQADALWDAVAIPGPHTPTYPEQHDRVCRAVAGILAELPAGRSAVLRDFLWRLEQSAGDAAAEKFLDDNPELRRLAGEAQPQETHSCRNCEGINPDSCLMNPDQPGRDQAALARVRRLHNALNTETGFTSPADPITRAAAAWKIGSALDGRTEPTESCADSSHQAHPGFTCTEVDQTRPYWEGRWGNVPAVVSAVPPRPQETK
nr:hypothetical protein OH837_48890 [Streptomyces canus]